MNGDWHDVKVGIEKPVVDLHANSHNLDFGECFSVKAFKIITTFAMVPCSEDPISLTQTSETPLNFKLENSPSIHTHLPVNYLISIGCYLLL